MVVLPVGSKPQAAVVVRIFNDERHELGAAAPLPTSTSSPEQGRAESSVEPPPKLVEQSGRDQPGSQNSYPHASLELL